MWYSFVVTNHLNDFQISYSHSRQMMGWKKKYVRYSRHSVVCSLIPNFIRLPLKKASICKPNTLPVYAVPQDQYTFVDYFVKILDDPTTKSHSLEIPPTLEIPPSIQWFEQDVPQEWAFSTDVRKQCTSASTPFSLPQITFYRKTTNLLFGGLSKMSHKNEHFLFDVRKQCTSAGTPFSLP